VQRALQEPSGVEGHLVAVEDRVEEEEALHPSWVPRAVHQGSLVALVDPEAVAGAEKGQSQRSWAPWVAPVERLVGVEPGVVLQVLVLQVQS
jgi:hypothetical protein